MGVEWSGLCGSDLRDAVGCFERVGRSDCLYGSGECANSCRCDADGSVGDGCEQERCYDDHSGTSAANRCCCESC